MQLCPTKHGSRFYCGAGHQEAHLVQPSRPNWCNMTEDDLHWFSTSAGAFPRLASGGQSQLFLRWRAGRETSLFYCSTTVKQSLRHPLACWGLAGGLAKTPETFFLEPSGSEHVQIPRFDIVGTWRLFPPFCDRNVHFGWFEGDWILRHPSSLSTHQLHWGWLLGTLIGLDGKTSWWKKKSCQARARKTSQVLFPLLPGTSSTTDARHCRKQDTAALRILSLFHINADSSSSGSARQQRKEKKISVTPHPALPLQLSASYFCFHTLSIGLPNCFIFRHRNYTNSTHSQGGPRK